MKQLIIFTATGFLLSLILIAPPSARAEHSSQAQVHIHLGAFWIPGVEGYVVYPPPAYVVPPPTVIVLPPVLSIDGLHIKRHHRHIHHDRHWTHNHKYWKHQDRSKSHRRFRE